MARTRSALPGPDEVEDLYALASRSAGDAGVSDAAALSATLYDLALDRDDVVAVTAREVGELVGFGYGHRWRWAEQTDDWSLDLAARLGADAAGLEDAFAVQLLAVHPSFTRHGLGFELLKRLMIASGAPVHWALVPDENSPAVRLFRRMGYRRLAHGPESATGSPGLLLVHG
ncbi:MAG: GNAT family N-acetyltransferase [Propionicimonas sp.]|uniref:GNAT family N-acetyltransferase n=1 Tax=Propionicimonas sp. TaxID=1955623 RepID=UPI003D11E291